MTSWRWGPDPSTVLLLLGSLLVPRSHRRCWAPPTWPSSTSTATTRRTGQASNSTTRVLECVALHATSLHFAQWLVFSTPSCVCCVVSVHSVIAVQSFTVFWYVCCCMFAWCLCAVANPATEQEHPYTQATGERCLRTPQTRSAVNQWGKLL